MKGTLNVAVSSPENHKVKTVISRSFEIVVTVIQVEIRDLILVALATEQSRTFCLLVCCLKT
jgi:hypothetical protein